MTHNTPYQPTGANVPLWAPYYGIGLTGAVRRYFKKYATFNGRASRSEYWFMVLFQGIVNVALFLLLSATGFTAEMARYYGVGGGPQFGIGAFAVMGVSALWSLICIIPGFAIVWRRLHDANLSGFWILINLVPGVGSIIMFVFMLLGPNPAGARFDRPGPA
jgi:uncharacterized membrane protein YhaH (DUF805 family)